MNVETFALFIREKIHTPTISVQEREGGIFITPVKEGETDPFYSEANMARLRKAIADINAGKLTEHELIRVDDDE